jgi:transposase
MKKPSRKIQSVYRNQNTLVRAVFERAGDARKVLCVALDYAKRKHVALICDGHGDVLKASFPVENNAAGIAHLIKEITATARRRKIPKDQIFLGGEDEAAYIANFTEALRAKGYLVVRVNAYEAKENRENLLASTDTLDLLGIAKTLLSRRARITGDTSSSAAVYHHLREVTRCRRPLVRQQTAASYRIHALADQLFPGFLNGSKSAPTPFCDASLELMKERFSAPEIARRKPASLANLLRRHRVHHPDEAAAQINQLAREALPPAAYPAAYRVATLQRTLAATVDLYQCLQRNAMELRTAAALSLATTPYVMLTSIPGIGFVLAAGLAGELGDPKHLGKLDSLCAYAGIVPRTLQSGGPDSPAVQGHASTRCNRILKDWTVQSAQKIHLYGPPELKDRITRWNANGQHGIFAAARHHLRLVSTLVKKEHPYLAPQARTRQATHDQSAGAAQATWTILQRKWRTVSGGLDLILDEAHPLGFWRKVMLELHGIDLPERQ